jgi:hypothetical protein
MTLKDAKLIADEFRKLTLVESAEVVANIDGHWSVRLTAILRNSSVASKILGTARVEEDFSNAIYATLGEGNITVFATSKHGCHGGRKTQQVRSSNRSNQAKS